jgi:predicted RNA-binding Zn-ribbon protein involved in translation (DUF1610 family)
VSASFAEKPCSGAGSWLSAETRAAVTCAECGREHRPDELWRLHFADLGEVYAFCPECGAKEFAE